MRQLPDSYPTDRPDARMPRPPCAVCSSHRTLTLFDRNIPCPACSAPKREERPLVHECPQCHRRESVSAGQPCGVCKGRELAAAIRRPQIASELWTLDAIVSDRRAAR